MKKYIIIFLVIIVSFTVYGRGNQENQQISLNEYTYEVSIEGMTCTLCSVAVEKQLGTLEWIANVHGDHEEGTALLKVKNEPALIDMKKAIAPELIKLGYTLIEIRELVNG